MPDRTSAPAPRGLDTVPGIVRTDAPPRPRSRSRALLLAATLLSGAAGPGCGGGTGGQGGPDAGSGGQVGTGGQTGSGGRTGTGGGSATGGQTGTGGLAGIAGQAGAAGQQGTAGAPATGGRGGNAGEAAGGRGGVGGAGTAGAPAPDGGATDASNDGGVTFSPCPPAGTACVIMPLGDSITDGFTPLPGGYRIELFHQMLLNRQMVTFVGSGANGPATVDGQPFPRQHEGHSGFTIDNAPTVGRSGISPLVDGAIASTRPDIILLMIGTNDIDLNLDAGAPTRLAALIDRILLDAPDALLVVGTIVPTRTDAENIRFQAYDAAMPALVQQRAAAGKHILLADNYAAIAANPNYKTVLLADNLHPTPAGYAVIGQTWYAAIRSFVPASP